MDPSPVPFPPAVNGLALPPSPDPKAAAAAVAAAAVASMKRVAVNNLSPPSPKRQRPSDLLSISDEQSCPSRGPERNLFAKFDRDCHSGDFPDLVGDASLQACTSLDESPAQRPAGPASAAAPLDDAREQRVSARTAAQRLSRRASLEERRKRKAEEAEERKRRREEAQERKKLKAAEMAEKRRRREEEKVRKAAEAEEKRRRRAAEAEERRRRKEEEEERKRRRKEEQAERVRRAAEEKKTAPVKQPRRRKEEVEEEEEEDGWKKNAGLTSEDRLKIPLAPMTGVERVLSWLWGKHCVNADLPPYLPLHDEPQRAQLYQQPPPPPQPIQQQPLPTQQQQQEQLVLSPAAAAAVLATVHSVQ